MSTSAPAAKELSSGNARGAVASLGINTGLYTVGNLMTKGIGFFLTIVLSWALTPAEYGIWGIALTVWNLLTVLLGLSLESAIRQMHVRYTEAERASLYGTLLAFWLVVPGLAALSLDLVGRQGWLDFIPSLPFDPYLRLVLWTSFLTLFVIAPQAMLMTRQEPVRVVCLAVGQALITALMVLVFTLWIKGGVKGLLTGYLIATAIMAAVSTAIMLRHSSLNFSLRQLREALRFSLPLVPHAASNWVMNMSDRMIMDKNVPSGHMTAGAIGHYNLGFQFGMLVSTFAASVNNAFFPIADHCLHDPKKRDRVPALGTYALAAVCMVSLVIAMLGGDVIRIATPEQHHGAAAVVPWLALAYTFQGLYFIWSRGTWFSMKTAWMPVITGATAALVVGLNLVLIPRFGIRAAAIDQVIALALLAAGNGFLASRVFPIAWEYRRWLLLFAAGLICFFLGQLINGFNPWFAVPLKSIIAIMGFPLILSAMGFFTAEEWREARTWQLSLRNKFC